MQGLDLAHPYTYTTEFQINLLIGADFYWNIVENQIIRGNGPMAVQSKLGYLLSGPIPPSEKTGDLQMFHTATQAMDDCSNIPKFWDIESASIHVITTVITCQLLS